MKFVQFIFVSLFLIAAAQPGYAQRAEKTSAAQAAYSMPSSYSGKKTRTRKVKKQKRDKTVTIKRKNRKATDAARHRRRSLYF